MFIINVNDPLVFVIYVETPEVFITNIIAVSVHN